MIDFTKKMKKSDAKKNDNPIDIYESLDRTSLAGPLRVSQEKVLRKWYEGKIDKKDTIATVYKGNIIKNLIMDCQSYTKYRPNETTGGIFVSWRRKEELPTGA